MPRFRRLVGALLLATTIAAPAGAVPVGVSTVRPAGLAGALGPEQSEIATIYIEHQAGQPTRHTQPPGWGCWVDQGPTHYQVTCVPFDGPRVCTFAYVLASYFGDFVSTFRGTTRCDPLVVTCSPSQTPLIQNYCEDHRAGVGMTPFVCRADAHGVLPLDTTAEWAVLCLVVTERNSVPHRLIGRIS